MVELARDVRVLVCRCPGILPRRDGSSRTGIVDAPDEVITGNAVTLGTRVECGAYRNRCLAR